VYGRAQARDGIVIDMTQLRAVHDVKNDTRSALSRCPVTTGGSTSGRPGHGCTMPSKTLTRHMSSRPATRFSELRLAFRRRGPSTIAPSFTTQAVWELNVMAHETGHSCVSGIQGLTRIYVARSEPWQRGKVVSKEFGAKFTPRTVFLTVFCSNGPGIVWLRTKRAREFSDRPFSAVLGPEAVRLICCRWLIVGATPYQTFAGGAQGSRCPRCIMC
jgi:hypothetical protein